MMTVLTAFIYRSRGRREGKGSTWHVYGPAVMAAVAAAFIMADLFRHVLQDTNVWPEKVFKSMEKADLVVGLLAPGPLVQAFYSPSNGGFATFTNSTLAITPLNVSYEDHVLSMCFSRGVTSGHYDAGNESFIIWALGTHNGSLDSIKHAESALDKQDSNPTMNWLVPGGQAVLSDPAASNQVTLAWISAGNSLSICVRATGPEVGDLSWLGLGFTIPQGVGSSQYKFDPAENCLHSNNERVACLTPVGIVFTLLFTYTGFVLLATATLWNANITEKLKAMRQKWHEIRNV